MEDGARGIENIYWISILNKDLFISDSVVVEESGKKQPTSFELLSDDAYFLLLFFLRFNLSFSIRVLSLEMLAWDDDGAIARRAKEEKNINLISHMINWFACASSAS